jgi:hypothetical protein
MDKKFKILSPEYKKYVNQIKKILENYNKESNLSFTDINSLYYRINDLNTQLLIVEKDIYNLFYNYEEKNETIAKLKDLVEKRNKHIITNLLKSKIYQDYIIELQNIYKKNKVDIEEKFFKLIKKYSMSWKCCWSFLDIDDTGNIKKIQLFDTDDIKLFKD